ncbi:MAG: hypothetical protein OXK77_04515 [Gemmatimonadota bacterium]|nr:hypothetical protein [Gemmatimonadota bacterium]MDE2863500.1 hypothetical protein [Gemmatimonadota bacterium]
MPVPSHPADALKSLFRDIFGCPGRDFGSPSRGVLGISDSNDGVQWNAGYRPGDGFIWLGVNLEGMRYDDWPVARLIEREIFRPVLLTPYRGRVTRPDEVTVQWTRDAWQYSARPPIREANLGPTPNVLDSLNGQGWTDALRGARECLDPRRQHRGRRKVPVTVLPSKRHPWERRVEMYVSPHLKIGTALAEITGRAMWEARDNLEPLYEFVAEQSRA